MKAQRWWRWAQGAFGIGLTGALVGCGAAPATSSSNEPHVTLKYSCPCTTDQPQTQAMQKFADEVKKLTNGAVTISVFPNGSLLAQNIEFQGLQKGSTDIMDSDPSMYPPKVAQMEILLTPYLFTSWSQVEQTFRSSDGQKLVDLAVQQLGVRPLDIQNIGVRELNLNVTKQIMTPDDLKGVKLRMPPGPYWAKLGAAMGGQVTPVAFNEIYLALQTGTVQAQDNPVPTDVANKFYEVTKQLVLTNHVLSPVMPTISEAAWKKLSPNEQKAVVKAAQDSDAWADQDVQSLQDQDVKIMEQHGIKVYTPNTAAFRSAVLKSFLCDPTFSGQFLPGMLSDVEKLTKATPPSC